MFVKIIALLLISYVFAQEVADQTPKCGTQETEYAPCLSREKADSLFKHCCSQYVPLECHDLCEYESNELKARLKILDATTSGKCHLKYLSSILYCASQNQDNRQCCKYLSLADASLGIGDRCLRFCDPGGEKGIKSINKADVSCLYNWNVIMYCHHAGIKTEV